jgi:hypothetical protein
MNYKTMNIEAREENHRITRRAIFAYCTQKVIPFYHKHCDICFSRYADNHAEYHVLEGCVAYRITHGALTIKSPILAKYFSKRKWCIRIYNTATGHTVFLTDYFGPKEGAIKIAQSIERGF